MNTRFGIFVLLIAIGASDAWAGQSYYVSERNAGVIWQLTDLNGDGDALDVDERVLWADGFTRVVELETDGRWLYAVEEGMTDGANQIIRLADLNGDGDALDVSERLVWADGLDDPRGIAHGTSNDWYVTEIDDDRLWRLQDLNGDGDALDVAERTLYADGIDGATTVMARAGDVLVTAFVGDQVHRLVDLTGDGDALDIGENTVIAGPINEPLGLLADTSGGFFFSSRSVDTVYHGRDRNGDGDLLDVAETLSYADGVFGGVNGSWDMVPFPGGGFLLADYLDGQVLLVKDKTGDGDALDLTEVTVWADGMPLVVDLVAAAGPGLLDNMLTIQSGPGTLDELSPNFLPIVNGSTVDHSVIEDALDSGTDVLVSTDNPHSLTRGKVLQEAQAPILKSIGGAVMLTIRADDDIELLGGISAAGGALGVVLIANDLAQSFHDLNTSTGGVRISAAIDIDSGDLTTSGVDFDNTGGAVTAGEITMHHTGMVRVGAPLSANAALNITAAGGVNITAAGRLAGQGAIAGDVDNLGTIAPGSAQGVINLADDYTQHSNGALEIEVAGTAPGSQHDQLAVSGSANIAGRLEISLINDFVPSYGDSFQIITFASGLGKFDQVIGAFVDPAMTLAPIYSNTNLTLVAALPGDGDLNGIVNFADFVLLSNSFGQLDTCWDQGNFNLDGITNFADFVILSNNFGTMVPAPADNAVPEPATLLLLMGAVIALRMRRA